MRGERFWKVNAPKFPKGLLFDVEQQAINMARLYMNMGHEASVEEVFITYPSDKRAL